MKKTHDAVATVGKYKDKDGAEKKRYVTVGAIFQDDQGRMSLKLDAVPCSPEWSGWISFYPKSDTPPMPPGRRSSPGMPAAPVDDGSQADEDDDIPF